MANTLTGLIPVLYEALDRVARELTGFIPSCYFDANLSERVAEGQTLRVPVTGEESASDITPGATAPNEGDTTIGYADIVVSKSRKVPVRFSGSEIGGLGGQYRGILVDRFAQGMRTLVNEIEADITSAVNTQASLAGGTAGTVPFASNLAAAAEARKLLNIQGASQEGRSLVLNTLASTNLITLANLTNVNQAGTDELIRRGVLLDLYGMAVRESAQISTRTKGTGTGYKVNKAGGLAVGDTTIPVDTGTGTIVAGDVVTIGNYKYVVATALASGSFTINEPGLKEAVADNADVTVNDNSNDNYAIQRNGLVLLMRAPSRPDVGDAADDVQVLVDPQTGLGFEVAMYRQYRQVYYEVAASWGVKVINPRYVIKIQG